jgi:hypothetical protein
MNFLKKLFGMNDEDKECTGKNSSKSYLSERTDDLDAKRGIELLAEVLANSKSKAVLFGAVAMGAYGYDRNTMDIDFMLPESNFTIFSNTIQSIGYSMVLKTEQYAKFRHRSTKLLDVDTVFISDDTAEKVILAAEKKEIWNSIFLCASLDTIISTKLHAITYNNERRGGKDLIDLLELLRYNKIGTDENRFRELCLKYSSEDVYKLICSSMTKT